MPILWKHTALWKPQVSRELYAFGPAPFTVSLARAPFTCRLHVGAPAEGNLGEQHLLKHQGLVLGWFDSACNGQELGSAASAASKPLSFGRI